MEPTPRPTLVIARGARAAEAALLSEVRAHAAAVRADPRRLAQPLRIVVPSRSLREHVAATIVREVGTVAGVAVQTLHGLACELLERAGAAHGFADDLFPLLVRREAARDPRLHAALDALEDGYAAGIGAVADFLDAGLSSVDAVEDALEEARAEGASREETDRAVALAGVAARVRGTLEAQDLGHRSRRLGAARDQLLAGGGACLSASAMLFHGFADATGLALDWIEAVCVHLGASVILDRPPDLAEAVAGPGARPEGEMDAIARFTARVFDVIGGRAHGVQAPAGPARERLALVSAPSPSAEVRAVAAEIRLVLDAGRVPPERIGVVARRIEPYGLALRLHFGRLGIPFSSPTVGPAGPALRRARALLDVLRLGGEAPIDRLLDAAEMPLGLRADLRLAAHALAAARIADVAALAVEDVLEDDGRFPLPVRRGLTERASDDEDGPSPGDATVVATRRRVAGTHLLALRACARSVLTLLPPDEDAAPLAEHVGRLVDLLAALVVAGEPATDPRSAAPGVRVRPPLEALAAELPGDVRLTRDELVFLLGPRLDEALGEPLGGAGGGVRVLDAMSARGCTFDRLFVLGLARGVFPRVIRADPLVPEGVRRALRRKGVLESFPVKEQGYDEERWLIAELLSAGREVSLSWPRADEDGRERAPSPFVEEIRLALGEDPTEEAPALHALVSPERGRRAAGPRTAHEHTLLAGVHDAPEAFAQALPLALAEAAREHAPAIVTPPPAALAAARLATIAELDLAPSPVAPLGPFFGFIGTMGHGATDPRRNTLAVTTLERVANCPWQAFLERMLRLEPAPDALGALPSLDRLIVGTTAHRALEEIARRSGAPAQISLADAARSPGVPLRWPDDAALEEILHAAARAELRDAHVSLAGFEPALVELVRPCLALARQADAASDAPRHVLGVEVTGACSVEDAAGRPRPISFRADRAERIDGALVLTDFKTGRPLSDAKGADTRVRHHLDALRRGSKLQAAAYARGAAAVSGGAAVGRYLHLRPDDAEPAVFSASADAQDFAEALEVSVRTLLRAVDAGTLFPRLEKPDGGEPDACKHCEVSDACLHGDSGARRRIAHWAEARRECSPQADGEPERAANAVWQLAGKSS